MNTIDRPFETSGYEQELISLIENGIIQQTQSIKFEDVAGLNEAKLLLQEAIVWPMEHPEFFKALIFSIKN